jgi:hypothetical protein
MSISLVLAACSAGTEPSQANLKDTMANTQPFLMVLMIFDSVFTAYS